MKKLSALLTAGLLVTSVNSFAENDFFCKVKKSKTGHYKTDDSYYIYKNFSIYRFEEDKTVLLPSKMPVRAIQEYNDYFFHLVEDHIVRRNLQTNVREAAFRTTKTFPTHVTAMAHDFVIANDYAYVAHGITGITKVDSLKGNVVKEITLESIDASFKNSRATGVAFIDTKVLVSLDRTRANAFQGIIELDDDLNLTRIFPYEGRQLSLPKVKTDNGRVYLKSQNDIHFFNYSDLENGKALKPFRSLGSINGARIPSNPDIKDGVFYGCIWKIQNRRSSYYHKKVDFN